MNILYLLFSFTTGGTERLVTDICNEMVCRDHQVHLYVVNDLYDQTMLDGLDPKVHVQLQKRPVGGGGKLETLRAVARYIRDNHVQIVHCNSFDAPELLLLKPFYCPKVKVLHTIHDVGQYQTLCAAKRLIRNRLCHRFIAISNCVKRDILRHGAAADKVRVVYNAIDISRFVPEQKAESSTIRIGHVARIMPEKKGQDILLDAIGRLHKKYPQLTCFFAGDADEAHQEAFAQLKQAAQNAGLSHCVSFLGNVTNVPEFLSTLDIFVLPSRYEGFGISLIEAMAMGIPCIASRLDGPAEVLQDGRYGTLFQPGDSQDLARALEQVILQLPEYRQAAAEAMTYVKETYNICTMCDQLEQVMCE